jgi:hypothetical protein
MNVIDSIPPERREAVLQRAELLIREERARRSAPDLNQNAAAAGIWGRVTAALKGLFR